MLFAESVPRAPSAARVSATSKTGTPRRAAAAARETTSPDAPFADRVAQKLVRVEPLADERDEQVARLDGARVRPHAAEHLVARGTVADASAGQRGGDAIARPEIRRLSGRRRGAHAALPPRARDRQLAHDDLFVERVFDRAANLIRLVALAGEHDHVVRSPRRRARARSPRAGLRCARDSSCVIPASMSSRIRSGSSVRGLSLVTIARSRLLLGDRAHDSGACRDRDRRRSRRRRSGAPRVKGRTASSARSSASGVCA